MNLPDTAQISFKSKPLAHNRNYALSDQTYACYRRDLRLFNQYISEKKLELNETSLVSYFTFCEKKGQKLRTINRKKQGIKKAMMEQANGDVRVMAMVEKLFTKVRTGKADTKVLNNKILSKEDIKILLDNASDKMRLVIRFLYTTGCRVSELTGIKLADISRGKVLAIRVIGKNRKERTIYIDKELYREIKDYFQGKTHLFVSTRGTPLSRNNIFISIRDLGRKFLKRRINCHMFRHSRFTHLLQAGQSLKAVSNYAGHSSTSITADFYIHDEIEMDVVTSVGI